MGKVWFVAVASVLALGGPAPSGTHVHQQDIAFSPKTATILVGESVDWDNHDAVTHTVTADDGSFDSGDMGQGATYARPFSTAGTYAYHCVYHAVQGMVGKVVVSDPNALADLAVTALEFQDEVPGAVKRINVTVRNLGLHAAGESVTRVVYLYQGETKAIGDVATPLLGPAEAFLGQVEWNTLGKVGDFAVRATADSDGQVAEGDESNNEASGTASVLVAGVPGVDLLDP